MQQTSESPLPASAASTQPNSVSTDPPMLPRDGNKLEDFLCHWRGRLRQSSRNLLGRAVSSRADTSDVAQEGILQAWQQLKNFRGKSTTQFAAWSRAIARGEAAKMRRHHQAVKRKVTRDVTVPDGLLDSQSSPAFAVEKEEILARLASAVADLPSEEQTVVLLRVFHDQTFVEIAAKLSTPESTVRGTFGRGLRRLKEVLREGGITEVI